MRQRTRAALSGIVLVLAIAAACSKANVGSPSGNTGSTGGGSGSAPVLTAPTVEAPSDDEPLTTLRPTLTVRNGTFRLVIRSGGIAGNTIYDRTISAPGGTGPYAPNPHFAHLGANSAVFNTETGSWPGITYRNVWLSDKPRPTSLGSALRPDR